jgi:hypothetical protein
MKLPYFVISFARDDRHDFAARNLIGNFDRFIERADDFLDRQPCKQPDQKPCEQERPERDIFFKG